MSLTCSNIDLQSETVEVRVGRNAAKVDTAHDNLISAIIPPGFGTGNLITLLLGGHLVPSTNDWLLNYTAPTLETISPTSGPAGTTIIVQGNSLGECAADVVIHVGQTRCGNVQFVELHRVLACTFPGGHICNVNGLVTVFVRGVQAHSETDLFFFFPRGFVILSARSYFGSGSSAFVARQVHGCRIALQTCDVP
eukprot:TRINITY_DN9999_c0_g4_i1.p1 TRINITY_DN9999_c0_g4~~TRINITY_DN9999_c0_g4_i1.p1  ORF type:complete len:195 (+),score=10.84 TRINITY_DN9999_c0_g4_i1:2-586(+)